MVKNKYLNNRIIAEDMNDIMERNIPWKQFDGCNVLITGAGGMIGSYMVLTLLWLEKLDVFVHVYAVVRNEDKFRNQFAELMDTGRLHIIVSDLSKSISIDAKIDYMIHAASLASSQFYQSYPMEVMAPNTIGTYHLLQLAKKHSVKGFLFFSSGEIYGSLQSEINISEDISGRLNNLDIRNCYAESKRAGEAMCVAASTEYGIPTKIARIFHTYAPTLDVDHDKRVFSEFVHDIINRQDIVMKSDGKAKRSFCYITDAISALFLILLKGKSQEAYNVCQTKEFISIRELAERILLLRPEENLQILVEKRNASEEYMENKEICTAVPLNTKVKELGAVFRIGIEEGFGRVIDFFEEQKL